MKYFNSRSAKALLLFSLAFFGFHSNTSAKSPENFAGQYNLFVTAENRDKPVPAAKGIQVLESFFSSMPLKGNMSNPDDMMSQQEFLIAFEMIKSEAEGKEITLPDSKLYYQAWLNARRHNWLPKPEMTYESMQEFLYRYQVSQSHADMPYYEGLVLERSEINADRFTTVAEVKKIQSKLLSHINELKLMSGSSQEADSLLTRLQGYFQDFLETEKEIIRRNSPANKIPNLPEDIKQKITENGLGQILNQMTYNYSRDTSNRRFNVIKGAMTLNGRVYQPGEEISFTRALEEGPGGLKGFDWGWTIHGAEEKWEYGGGLCGSATLFFTPSWRGGLEIVSRRNHSSYFSNLYPPESLGIDATIYFGSTDVIMKNNTPSPLLYYVYDNTTTKEITLYVIGNSPYIDIKIEGPIKMGTNSFRFLRHMTLPDGQVITETVNSRYSKIY